jgi:hypothetical protein
MNKLNAVFRLSLFLLTLSLPAAALSGNAYRLPVPMSREYNSIHYSVSPGIELISIVQTISEYPTVFGFLMQADSFQYKQEVWKKFGPLKDHPVVAWVTKTCMQPRKMNFSAPSNVMLYADDHVNLRSDLHFDDFVLSRAGGRDSLILFFDLLRDFAIRSSFNEFYEQHAGYYTGIIQHTISRLDSINHIKELESFYGAKQKSYNIVLVPLYSHVGYGNSIVYQNGEREMFDTMGPECIKDGLPFFGDTQYLKYMTRHEFSHPFVNPLTEKYWSEIKDYAGNYNFIPDAAKKNVCGEWQECINEFIVRAVSVDIAFHENKELGQQVSAKEKSRGVSYLEPLLTALQEYENNRSKYPTFESYYPKVLEVFKK